LPVILQVISPVDLLRRTRQKIVNQFESRVTITEEIFKKAEKSKRGVKRAIKKAKKSSSLVPIPKAQSFAELRLSSEASFQDVLKFNEKHQLSEKNWLRKVDLVSGEGGNLHFNFLIFLKQLTVNLL